MISPLKFLLANQLKRPRKQHKTGGFTLIELLVAVILAFLILAPLLGFMINIMETDRKEQAKASSEQELKAALDYMAEDLRQAVYIYDANGLDATNGIGNEIPPAVTAGVSGCNNSSPNQCTPVLVFWKREQKRNVIRIGSSGSCPADDDKCDDAFVYSLVGYYLITGNNSNKTWSDVSRIARFEISGGVANAFDEDDQEDDGGFNNLSTVLTGGTGTIPQRMARWDKGNTDYDINFANNVLIDYIDKSITGTNPTIPSQIACDTTAVSATDSTPKERRVPQDNSINNFYACVGTNKNYARIYIRGNALARLRKNNTNYNSSQAAFFPTATIQVEGSGSLYAK